MKSTAVKSRVFCMGEVWLSYGKERTDELFAELVEGEIVGGGDVVRLELVMRLPNAMKNFLYVKAKRVDFTQK